MGSVGLLWEVFSKLTKFPKHPILEGRLTIFNPTSSSAIASWKGFPVRKTFHWQEQQLSMRLPSQVSMRGACRAQRRELVMFACCGWRNSLQSYGRGKNTWQCEWRESVRGGERVKGENTCRQLSHRSSESALVAVLARAAATPPASAPAGRSRPVFGQLWSVAQAGWGSWLDPSPNLLHHEFVPAPGDSSKGKRRGRARSWTGCGTCLTSHSPTAKCSGLSYCLTLPAGLLWGTCQAKLQLRQKLRKQGLSMRLWSKISLFISRILL